jgi:hypothetical protein
MAKFCFIVAMCYIPFQDRLKRSALRIAVETFSFLLTYFLVFILIAMVDDFNEGLDVGALLFLWLALFRYYTKTGREGFQKLLFMFCAAFHMNSCLELFIYMICAFFGVQKNFPIAVSIDVPVYTLG